MNISGVRGWILFVTALGIDYQVEFDEVGNAFLLLDGVRRFQAEVTSGDRLIVTGDTLNADDRTEAFLAHQLHLMTDIGQHGRLEPVARLPDAMTANQ